MELHDAATDEHIAACYPVMCQLRADVEREDFVALVKRQMGAGYRLSYLQDERGEVVAVAGYRFGESLAWGRYVYVDDLVTSSRRRSQGHGATLLGKICTAAKDAGCRQLHLDSGIEREAAHRFYEREGLTAAALHFVGQL